MGRGKTPHPSRTGWGRRAAGSTLSPWERANGVLGAPGRAMTFSLSLGADLYPYLRLDTGVWVLSAPKGRNNEAQANGLGPRVRRSPILKP